VDDRFTPTQVRFYGCRMRVGRGLLAVVSGSLLGLAACSGGGDDPVVLPSGTTEATTTPTVSETTAVPPPTSEPTPTTSIDLPNSQVEEADAFVREFFDAYNAAQDSGDLSAFDAMYLPQCAGCTELREELVGWLDDGTTIEGADWIVQGLSSTKIGVNAGTIVLAYRAEGSVVSGADSTLVPMLQSQVLNVNVRRAEPWIIEDLAFGDAT